MPDRARDRDCRVWWSGLVVFVLSMVFLIVQTVRGMRDHDRLDADLRQALTDHDEIRAELRAIREAVRPRRPDP